MEFNFSVETKKPALVIKEEYRLFWLPNKNNISPDEIGSCKVQVEGNQVVCMATVSTGGIQHSINDVTTAEFSPNDILAGKYEYGILLKDDIEGNEYVYGFCLS